MRWPQCIYSLNCNTSCHTISQSLEAARVGVKIILLFWNSLGPLDMPAKKDRTALNYISRVQDFARFPGETSYHLLKRSPGPNVACDWRVLCSTIAWKDSIFHDCAWNCITMPVNINNILPDYGTTHPAPNTEDIKMYSYHLSKHMVTTLLARDNI